MTFRDPMPRWLRNIWVDYSATYIEVGWREHSDDPDFYMEPPMWVWRPFCWVYGHSDDTYGSCVTCRKVLHGR